MECVNFILIQRQEIEMAVKKHYFPEDATQPQPLTVVTERRVRFEEVDSLGMVWHGRYPSYFEDGRIAIGDAYGLSYQTFMDNKIAAPIVQMHLDYKSPLRFDEIMVIETTLHWTDAAKLNYSYLITNKNGVHVTSGYTVQLFTAVNGTVMLVIPEWLEEFRRKWQEGWWSKR